MDLNEQILSLFKNMITDIVDILPEGETQLVILDKYSEILKLEELKLEDNSIISDFLQRLNKISTKITNKDESIFDENIILYIPIKTIWSDYMEDVDKNKIWKFLQTFCIININLNSSNELKKLLSGESNEIQKDNKKDIKDLKKIKKLKSSINDINKEEETREKENNMGGLEGLEGLDGVFENTGIGKLAKNIAENMDFEAMMGDMGIGKDMGGGEPDMAKMMQNMMNPSNFMNLFQNINEQVREQIDSGSISEETLSGEAESLYGNFANNPMFKNMMDNPELQKMQQQMHKTQGSPENTGSQANPVKNETQERLRKKLAKKKENNS